MLTKTKQQFSSRFRDRLRQTILDECKARGLPHFLDLGKNGSDSLALVDHVHDKRRGEHVALLTAGGWAKYSRRFMAGLGFNGIRKDLAILGGTGRQGAWAARVPSTCTDVGSALEWLKPGYVQAAERTGRKVLRQGDVWIVETRRPFLGADNTTDLPASHHWLPLTRTLVHEEHGELHVPFTFRVIPQRTLAADGRRRRQGD